MVQTRGSDALDKAQRRIALMKSIDENLDLGNDLTIAAYNKLIEESRAALEAHNTLKSQYEASCDKMKEIDKTLSSFSGRMLAGVAAKYGRNSVEYIKAGGSNGTRSSGSSKKTTPDAKAIADRPATPSNASEQQKAA